MATAAMQESTDAVRRGHSAVVPVASLWRLAPAILLAYSILLPLEMRIVISEQVIYPSRFAVFLVTPWLLRELAIGRLKSFWPDLLVFFAAGWMVISFIVAYGPANGLLRGGALALDLAGPYLIARLCIREPDDLRRLIVFLIPGAAFAGASLLVESLSATPIVRPLAASIFGDLPLYEGGVAIGEKGAALDFRFGLLRASGPFAHSIYAGLFLSSLLPLVFFSGLRRWPRKLGLVTAGFSLFTVSSAAILGLFLSTALMAADRLQREVRQLSWTMMVGAGAALLIFVQVASQNGLIPILIRMTLNPQTGYYRLIIWRFGVESVERHPLFGIAFAVYDRPEWMNTSIDSYWLMIAIRHGIAVPFAILAACIAALVLTGRRSRLLNEIDRKLLVGVAITLACLVVAGFTVAFVGGILTWFLLILGAAISLAHSHRA